MATLGAHHSRLVSDRKQGRWSYYRLNADPFEEVREIATALRSDAR